jgi:hypothetical protein
MATYTVIPRPLSRGFNVLVVGDNGARQTMLNFQTEAEAQSWIDADMKLDARWASTEWGLP